jgi:flagellar assembly protein FliH
MTSSRLIRGDGTLGQYVAWKAPEVGTPGGAGNFRRGEGDPAAVQQRAWQQGFDQGRAAGIEAGMKETAARAAAVERVLDALARPLEDLDHRVEEEILALVHAIVRQLVRREIHLDPTHIVGVIREALAALPVSAEDVTVRLHPEDADVVRGCLPPAEQDRAWKIEADPLLERGGCLVSSARSNIDGTLDARLSRVVAGLFEDERSHAG